MKKIILSVFCLFLATSFTGIFAQQQSLQQQQIDKVEQQVEEFTKENMQNVPQEQLTKMKNSYEIGEHGFFFNDLSPQEQKEYVDDFKENYLRVQYFKNHPEAWIPYQAEMAPICVNGGFENGFNNYEGQSAIGFNGGYTGSANGECSALPTSGFGGFTWTPTTLDPNNNNDNFTLVGAGNDPIVATDPLGVNQLSMINPNSPDPNNSTAVRINSARPLPSSGSCSPNRGINRLIKPITLTEDGIQVVRFYYALVAEFPNHNNANPIFVARALDGNDAELDRLCVISNPAGNAFFTRFTPNPYPCTTNQVDILWQDWTCAELKISGNAGDVINLEFIASDCGAGAHFGYAYIDDICVDACQPGDNFQGSIQLNEFDPCEVTLPFDVCADFTLPQLNGQTGTLSANDTSLDILQNGAVVQTLQNGVITGNTICFNVTAADLIGQNGGYDFQVNAEFTIGNGMQTADDVHTIPGQNNDYIFDNPDCCNENASPNFTLEIKCDNGNFSVTATASDLTAGNHWWGLMETSVEGSTLDADTVDGNPNTPALDPVASIQSGTSATFSWIDLSAHYYIKHGIWDDCYGWREVRIPVPEFEADVAFHFQDADGTIKDEFCYGEDIYLNGIASQGENRYFIDTWRRPIGSTQNFNYYAGLGWTTNAQVGIVNLTQELANLNPSLNFEPGYEYEVKLAIANLENCIGWTPITHTFILECCEDGIDAGFDSYQDTTGNIGIIGFELYDNINAVHEWYVLSSPNQFGGPYTPVYSTTTTGPAPHTLVINAQPLLFYTVIHKVITDCGEVCTKNVHYFNKGESNLKMADDPDPDVDCCLAFEFWPNGPGNPEVFTAEFNIGIDPQTGIIQTYVPNIYPNNTTITHEWFLFSSPNETGGPYTLVDNQTGATYQYNAAQDGLYYFLFHKVKSDCGEVCYGQSICRNCGEEERDGDCAFCGVIDCSLIDSLLPTDCEAPTDLRFDCRRAGMSWTGDPTLTYTVEVGWDDPACCRSKYPPTAMRWEVTGTSFQLPYINDSNCFSWKVGVKCKDGIVWSASQCIYCYGDGRPNDVPSIPQDDGSGVKTSAKISPNPNDGNMNIEISGNDKTAFTLKVYRFDGVLIKTFNENRVENQSITISWNGKSVLTQGMYFFVITTDKETITKKVIIE
jgi:hypothetical protein